MIRDPLYGGKPPEIPGLHHVTAITGDAAGNVLFYTRVLGMRLVKRTVNQDDINAYHLFYGDDEGHPGSELTFFHWPKAGPNRPGAGTVSRVSLAVPGPEALRWWHQRLGTMGVAHGPILERNGHTECAFSDPEGQRLALVSAPGSEERWGRPWTSGPVPTEHAVRGLYGVTLEVPDLGSSVAFATEHLGFRVRIPGRVLESGAGGAGTVVELDEVADPGQPGIGGVHHVAFRTPDDVTQERWLRRLAQISVPHSPIIDRFYFRSLYFREAGGVLFEIATDGPGFGVDETAEELGRGLSLPPFLEPHRAAIERSLPPLSPPEPVQGGH